MSSSATQEGQSPEVSPNNQQKQLMDKKKIKVLKTALKDERNTRASIEKELEGAYERIESLKQQMVDQEQRYTKLYQENLNLQDALMRESKPKNQNANKPKIPLLAGNSPKNNNQNNKETTNVKQVQNGVEQEAFDAIQVKCKAYEDIVQEKDKQILDLQGKLDEYSSQVLKMQMLFDQKLNEINKEKENFQNELYEKEQDIEFQKKGNQQKIEQVQQEMEEKINTLSKENKDLLEQRNNEIDKNLKTEEIIDAKNDKIQQLEKEIQRKADEVKCRKEIIESMTATLMKHEKDTAEMSQKLTLMKNQIIEHDTFKGLSRKYAGIKINKIKDIPVYFEFVQENSSEFFIVIDSRQFEISININRVETFQENKDQKLNIVYYVPDSSGTNFTKKNELYDCCEIDEMMKTFKSIISKLEAQKKGSNKVNSGSYTDGLQMLKQQSTPSMKSRKNL